eukprot:CAMPEP_0197031596 /NCGR_PEP_ID=MMETSP1384-20130603/10563_1 /TAXON_ID=29189 /ORGANISM="Ammonia sp." /LENGTH=668 /DNA_ID=CAMNT_0042461149 /DNA_START=28 /DNA_END=2030 /DNA_ORIENTATION=+
MAAQYKVGDKIVLFKKHQEAFIRYIGKTQFAPDKVSFGIELLEDGVGDNNGTVDNVEYFQCAENKGLFIVEKDIKFKIEMKKRSRSRGGSFAGSPRLQRKNSGQFSYTDVYAERSSSPKATRTALKKKKSVKKLGPRDLGRNDDYPGIEDGGALPVIKDLSKKKKSTKKSVKKKVQRRKKASVKKLGPRDVGRNDDWKGIDEEPIVSKRPQRNSVKKKVKQKKAGKGQDKQSAKTQQQQQQQQQQDEASDSDSYKSGYSGHSGYSGDSAAEHNGNGNVEDLEQAQDDDIVDVDVDNTEQSEVHINQDPAMMSNLQQSESEENNDHRAELEETRDHDDGMDGDHEQEQEEEEEEEETEEMDLTQKVMMMMRQKEEERKAEEERVRKEKEEEERRKAEEEENEKIVMVAMTHKQMQDELENNPNLSLFEDDEQDEEAPQNVTNPEQEIETNQTSEVNTNEEDGHEEEAVEMNETNAMNTVQTEHTNDAGDANGNSKEDEAQNTNEPVVDNQRIPDDAEIAQETTANLDENTTTNEKPEKETNKANENGDGDEEKQTLKKANVKNPALNPKRKKRKKKGQRQKSQEDMDAMRMSGIYRKISTKSLYDDASNSKPHVNTQSLDMIMNAMHDDDINKQSKYANDDIGGHQREETETLKSTQQNGKTQSVDEVP